MSDLRERVAKEFAGIHWSTFLYETDALIRAEVLEEAAKVAETTFGEGYHIAAAIRALEART